MDSERVSLIPKERGYLNDAYLKIPGGYFPDKTFFDLSWDRDYFGASLRNDAFDLIEDLNGMNKVYNKKILEKDD